MEAIVLVNQDSAFAHLNYQTFKVAEIGHGSFELMVNNKRTYFNHKEVIIVSPIIEFKKIAGSYTVWDFPNIALETMTKYMKHKGIMK